LGSYSLQDKALTLLSPVERIHAELLCNCHSAPHFSALQPSYCLFRPLSIFQLYLPFLPLLEVFHVSLA